MEYAKNIEKNRPSPKAEIAKKINFEQDIKEQTPAAAGSNKVFDKETKTFKMVNTVTKKGAPVVKKQKDDTKIATTTEKLSIPDHKSGSQTSREQPSSRMAQGKAEVRENSKTTLTTDNSSKLKSN